MIRLSARHLAEIKRHAEQEYPHECCGLLIGRIVDGGRTREIAEIHPVANTFTEEELRKLNFDLSELAAGAGSLAKEERHHRMLISPLEYARAERHYSARGLGVVGNYHSHPDHPAVPSQFDLKHLAPWPTMSYIVVSVRAGKATDLFSWEIEPDGSKFNQEEIIS
jgi:proteasome lid subunit RPN8/RPN11